MTNHPPGIHAIPGKPVKPEIPLTRLAPSPTGALHLGNARTFLINWAVARNEGWTLIVRIEDLDSPRIKTEAANQVLDSIQWLGLDFDGTPYVQSHDLEPYRQAMQRLVERGLTYPCRLTRREIEAASSAPHKGDHELRFGPELRPAEIRDQRSEAPSQTACGAGVKGQKTGADHDALTTDLCPPTSSNYRLLVEDEIIRIHDQVMGACDLNPFREVGDFVIWTKRGVPAYQLAVVVDDARQGVTDVVRGADLLPSAARQELLYRALGLAPPRWWHLPLVLGPDGRRLAKRHGDTRIDFYREKGVPPERVIGLLAHWSGVLEHRDEISAQDFRQRFDLNTLPRSPITFTNDDHHWLLGKNGV